MEEGEPWMQHYSQKLVCVENSRRAREIIQLAYQLLVNLSYLGKGQGMHQMLFLALDLPNQN